ncbi:hypothetical protein [Azospirillum palustre]|uniref:hypothetical protein n=1 Tax=Azospirillum palustre TaxID=2044885 RepID=UPI0011785AD2|nr:hypothetical protein [Azospirillum palustre]
MKDEALLDAGLKLASALNSVADSNLPQRLSDIVKLHAKIAVGAALVPIPIADMAAAGANIWTMYIRINKEIDLPFSDNIIKSIAAGVLTNIGGAVAGAIAIGTALKIVPGLGSIGGAAVMSATVYAVTIVSGIIYMKALAKLIGKKNLEDISESDIKKAAEEEMSNKSNIKEMFKEAKSSYKSEK